MASSLAHDGFQFHGVVKPHTLPDWVIKETKFGVFGLDGVGTLFGGRSHRDFTIPIWIFNSYTQAQLIAYIDSIHERAGHVGSLVYTNAISRTLQDVQFIGLVEDMMIPPNADKGWSLEATLRFCELAPA